jgi:hypothetical protein
LIQNLRSVFKQLQQHNVFLNPLKTQLCKRSITWCGRLIDKHGVTYDRSMINGLIELRSPRNGQELQQFVCACNWMRSSIPSFSQEISPLQTLLCTRSREVQTSKTKILRKIPLNWTEQHEQCFQKMKDILKNLTKLTHFDPTKELCFY